MGMTFHCHEMVWETLAPVSLSESGHEGRERRQIGAWIVLRKDALSLLHATGSRSYAANSIALC